MAKARSELQFCQTTIYYQRNNLVFWELTGKPKELSSMSFHVPEWKAKQHKHHVENKARINWLSQRRWGGGGLQSLYKISPTECIAEKQLSHELLWAGFRINWLGWDCALSLTSLACQAMLNLQPQTQCQIPYVSLLFLNHCLSACCSSCFFAWRWPWPATTPFCCCFQGRHPLSRATASSAMEMNSWAPRYICLGWNSQFDTLLV